MLVNEMINLPSVGPRSAVACDIFKVILDDWAEHDCRG